MDYKTAFEILEIDVKKISYQEITHSYLKTKYHKLALLNHPDKNGNTPESNEKFKKINEAYLYLDKEICNLNGLDNKDVDDNCNSQDNIFKNNSYKDFVNVFIGNVIDGRYNDLIKKVIKEILIVGCKNISLKIFEDLDKESSFNVYTFLSKHRFLFHLNEENMRELREKLLQKYSNVVIYKLNPSIDDLMDNNLYKLYVDEQLYLVPLWHNELYYDGSGCEIIAICEPELPKGINIDEDNNIYIEKSLKINEIASLFDKNIQVQIGKRIFDIPTENLQIKREQLYTIKQQGLAQIKENDIYDVSKRTDIIVKIIFE